LQNWLSKQKLDFTSDANLSYHRFANGSPLLHYALASIHIVELTWHSLCSGNRLRLTRVAVRLEDLTITSQFSCPIC